MCHMLRMKSDEKLAELSFLLNTQWFHGGSSSIGPFLIAHTNNELIYDKFLAKGSFVRRQNFSDEELEEVSHF